MRTYAIISPSCHSESYLLFHIVSLELTFIILARPLEPILSDIELANEDIKALPMIGDVNLFFKNPREDPEFEAECEVMIAGPCSTRLSSSIAPP